MGAEKKTVDVVKFQGFPDGAHILEAPQEREAFCYSRWIRKQLDEFEVVILK